VNSLPEKRREANVAAEKLSPKEWMALRNHCIIQECVNGELSRVESGIE
jgi:hypothetical protein